MWTEVKLVDVAEKVQYGYTESASLEPIGPRFLRITDIVEDVIRWDEVPFCSINSKDRNKYGLNLGDIVIARTGNTTGWAKLIRKDVDAVFASYLIRVVVNERKVLSGYIGRLIESYLYKDFVWSVIGGSAQPGANAKLLTQFEFPLPPIGIQQSIVSILSAYDELILNNLRQIRLLEELAQITYNQWFGQIEGVLNDWKEVNLGSLIGHEIGGGWGDEVETTMYNAPAYVIRGTDMNELPNGKIAGVPFRYHKESNLASRKLQDGDIVFEVSGGSTFEGVAKTILITEELLSQFDHDVMCASFCKLVRPAKREHSYFLFHFLRFLRQVKGTEVFEIRSASNIVNYNWTAFLKFQKVKKPTDDHIKRFNEIVEPIHKLIYNLGHQNQLLIEARDILLPRLMTGMIDVEKISNREVLRV